MKRIYEEFLHIPEDGKIKEKVFITRIVIAIVCVVSCLSAMGFSAYAFFASSITSDTNMIAAASFSADTSIATNVNDPQTRVTPTVNQNISTYSLVKGTYFATIKATGNAKNGYCKIVVGDVNSDTSVKYYTVQLNTDATAQNNQIEFMIECYDDEAQVHIIPNWGSCSETDSAKIIEQNEKLTIGNPNLNRGSETSNTGENIITDLETEAQDLTSTSNEGADKSNESQEAETSDDTTADGVSDEIGNGEIDDGSSDKAGEEN